MTKRIYLTTPIYYANGAPHSGHAYTSLIGDVVARAKRMLGYDVKYATGTDENGQKMVQVAQAVGKEVKVFLDEVAAEHRRTLHRRHAVEPMHQRFSTMSRLQPLHAAKKRRLQCYEFIR